MSRSSTRGVTSSTNVAVDRAVFILLAFMLTTFGLIMVYSASSVVAMISEDQHYNPSYFFVRQIAFIAIGTVLAFAVSRFDYHVLTRDFIWFLCAIVVILLFLVFIPGIGKRINGSSRWIRIGSSMTIQPSEFAKPVILLAIASIFEDFRAYGGNLFAVAKRLVLLVGVPLFLILIEPDKGTVLTICFTIVLMMYLAGLPRKYVLGLFGAAVLVVTVLAVASDYSRARIMTLLNPWADAYGDGYQVIQGLYAFASGGLFGVGVGNSHQKFSYLPEAHNDFIFAVIGEELGLVGSLSVLVLFFALVYIGFRIAKAAPDLSGTLVASGSVTILAVQMLINACGVLDLLPLSGKPVPFLSYGGSSIMATLILVGMVLSVARTTLTTGPVGSFAVREGGNSRGFRVIQGGAATTPSALRSEQRLNEGLGGRITYNANGTRRINLGPSASDRLRRSDSDRGRRG